jgi:hypothetical protein
VVAAEGIVGWDVYETAAEGGEHDLDRALAAVGDGAVVDVYPGPLDAASDGGGYLDGGERPFEGVRRDEDGRHVPATCALGS